jgi:hypothetical protein
MGLNVIGVEWNQGTDTWTRIDENGNTLGHTPDFDTLSPWKDIIRVTIDSDGRITDWASDGKGTGIILDGSGSDEVFVQIPRFYVKASNPLSNVYRWWVSSVPMAGYKLHPAFNQRGMGTFGGTDFIYIGAYDAGIGYESHTSTTKVFQSRSGVQPYTGTADCIWEVDFDAGNNEPTVGDELSNGTEAGFYLVDYCVTSGSWAGNDAAGKLLMRKPGDNACSWANDETITNVTQSNTLATVDTNVTGETATIETCRTYAGNIATGFGLMNIWSLSAIRMLYYIEYAGADSQTDVGKGVVDKANGIGFNGELTGADSIDSNLASSGTGAGTGTDGETPIAYRGIENLWGNIWQFIDGYEAVDAEYRIINRDGSGTFANPIAGGDYEASFATPITSNGWQSNIEWEDLLALLLIPSAVAGSSSSYLYDYFYAHDATETNILRAGSNWTSGALAGIGYLSSLNVSTYSSRYVGGRLEFIG